MIDTNQLYRDLDQGPVIVQALSSITHQQADTIVRVVVEQAPNWTVQTCDDYDGYLSILIEPVERSKQPAYYISGTSSRIELAEIHQEQLNELDCFHDVRVLTTYLADLLTP